MAEEADQSSLKVLKSLEQSHVREELITLLHYTLTLISSHWRRDRRRKLISLSTSPFQIQSPLLLHVSADSLLLLMVSELYPNLIPEVLCSRSDQNEILWNFSRIKDERRLTLKENPRFYEVLPTLPENYRNNFLLEPIEVAFLEPIKRKSISVLVDKSGKEGGRVFLKITKARAFENAWDLKNAIVFKGSSFLFYPFSPSDVFSDVFGKLEGEGIVDAAIQNTPNLWCFTEPPPSHSSRSSNRSCPSPTTVATPTTSSTGLLLTDWREPIRQMLRSPDVNIRISTQPPINSIPQSPGPFSPISRSGFSSSAGSRPPASAELSPRSPARSEPPFKVPSRDQPKAEPALSAGNPFSTPAPPQPPSVVPPSGSSATPARITQPPDTQRASIPPPQKHAPAAVKAAVPIIQEPQTPKRKKNWFQKHIYDYGK